MTDNEKLFLETIVTMKDQTAAIQQLLELLASTLGVILQTNLDNRKMLEELLRRTH